MRQPGCLQCAALLLGISLCHTAQHASAKTLPVPYPNDGGLLPVNSGTSARVTGFDGPEPSPAHTFILLYNSKHMGSAPLGAGKAIESAHGTIVAQHPAIGVAFATSANSNFAKNVMAADPRLTHVASTAGVRGRARRKASVEPHANSAPGGSSGGGSSSTSNLDDSSARILSRKESAGTKPGSQLQGGATGAAGQRHTLATEPVPAPSGEGVTGIVLASAPNSTAGAALCGRGARPVVLVRDCYTVSFNLCSCQQAQAHRQILSHIRGCISGRIRHG